MGKKPILSVTYENERISKKQFTLLKMCVTSLLCGPRADLWPFYGFICKRFSPYIKVWSTGRFMAVLWVFMQTVFSLYKGSQERCNTHFK